MTVFEMVVAIVFVSCGAGVINNWLKTRSKVDRGELDQQLDARRAQIEKLEKRVRVLERIVTDRHYDQKKELDELETH